MTATSYRMCCCMSFLSAGAQNSNAPPKWGVECSSQSRRLEESQPARATDYFVLKNALILDPSRAVIVAR